MTENTTPSTCDEHHFAEMILDEVTLEEFGGRDYAVYRFVCNVKGCTTTNEAATPAA